MVQEYNAVRPGFLLLAPDGTRWGSIPLSPVAPSESVPAVKEYLLAALRSETTLADATSAPQFDLDLLEGYFLVKNVSPESVAASLGIRSGDKIRKINGTPVSKFGDALVAIRDLPDGALVPLELERAGTPIRIQAPCELPDVEVVFVAQLDGGSTLELKVK